MIDGPRSDLPAIKNYEIIDSLIFPNQSYSLERIFQPFEKIHKGQKLANGDQGPLYAPCDGCVIFAPKGLNPSKWDEEVLFISKIPESLFT